MYTHLNRLFEHETRYPKEYQQAKRELRKCPTLNKDKFFSEIAKAMEIPKEYLLPPEHQLLLNEETSLIQKSIFTILSQEYEKQETDLNIWWQTGNI